MKHFKRTVWDGRSVILTEGGSIDGGPILYGVFERPRDARSENADDLAIAIVHAESLTEEQIEIARRNSEVM